MSSTIFEVDSGIPSAISAVHGLTLPLNNYIIKKAESDTYVFQPHRKEIAGVGIRVFTFYQSPSTVRDRLLQYAAESEREFLENQATFCLQNTTDRKTRRNASDDKLYFSVRTRFLKKEITARRLDVAIAPGKTGSTMTIGFHPGLPMLLFPFSIAAVVSALILVFAPAVLLFLELGWDNNIIQGIFNFIVVTTALTLVEIIPGYFVRTHISAGNYVLNGMNGFMQFSVSSQSSSVN